MNLERYEIEQIDEFTYRFFSRGTRGVFEMRVCFRATRENTYNLGFGVIDPDDGWLDDLIELRNGDTQKILATVANCALIFLDEHPRCRIHATGSTPSRTRLYQMGINRVLPELTDDYAIAGLIVERDPLGEMQGSYPQWKGEWRELRKGISYDAFLIFKL
jgi:hypothetical protein